METVSRLLNQPEHLHAIINHFPLVGLLAAALALAAGVLARSKAATLIGLALVAVFALSAWPVYYFGEQGYDRVLSMSDDAGQAYLRYHQELAERWVFLFYLTAGVATLGLAFSLKWSRVVAPAALAALALCAASLIAGVLIAQVGGEIRHREFREGQPPPLKAPA